MLYKVWQLVIERSKNIPKRFSWFRKYLLEVWQFAFVFILVFFIIQPFVVANYDTPTGSMEPTIMTNTRYFALPSSYGGFVRFTKIKFPGYKKIHRGDIIIFKYPLDESKNYVKRVIGLPGEQVEINGKIVYINNKALYEPYTKFNEYEQDNSGRNYGPVTVPKNHLFVMGDNRDNSCDSRYWGFVPVRNVFGTPLFTYWSYDGEQHRVRTAEIFKILK